MGLSRKISIGATKVIEADALSNWTRSPDELKRGCRVNALRIHQISGNDGNTAACLCVGKHPKCVESPYVLTPARQCTSTPRSLSSSASINVIAVTRCLRISSSSVSSSCIWWRLNVYFRVPLASRFHLSLRNDIRTYLCNTEMSSYYAEDAMDVFRLEKVRVGSIVQVS